MVYDIGRIGLEVLCRRCHGVFERIHHLPTVSGGEKGRRVSTREPTPFASASREPATTVVAPIRQVAGRSKLLISEVLRDVKGVETVTGSNRRHLDAAIEWLYTAQDATDVAGCASVYNLVLGWGGPYPETTGYIIPTLFDYANLIDTSEPRNRAEDMADWLLEVQFDDGSFPGGDDPANETEPSIFNTGQILFGLVRAHEELGKQRYYEAARRAGEWLADVQHEDGYWDQYDYNNVVHSYSARVGWALARASELTGEERLRDAALNNLQWVVTQRQPNGWFDHCGFDTDEDPFLHTIAYTIRGLLEGGYLLDDEEIVREARASADAFLDLQTQEGILLGRYDERLVGSEFYCLTGNAQMAVVWYRLFEETGETAYRRGADETLAFLKSHQRMDGPLEVRGGLKGSAPVWGPYMYLRYPNWAAKFLADAFLLAEQLPAE
jgi:uncharacterized protein YyaL (SSP411 family)